MNPLGVAVAARSFRDGRAVRTAVFRHRRLAKSPIALVLWQLGGEPFAAAAIGYGRRRRDFTPTVAGDPVNRDLAFAALSRFADWFNPRFEEALSASALPDSAPQIVVANQATVQMIGSLGRRLAYLPLDGPHPAPSQLVRLGQHFLFLARHSRAAGQQLIVPMTDLLGMHWATPQSCMERQSLSALNAYIESTGNPAGFFAAMAAEDTVGPVPSGDDNKRLEPMVEEFNRRRNGRTDLTTVEALLAPIASHYGPLVFRTWELIWDCHARELQEPEAPSVQRRWIEDVSAHQRHMEWVNGYGHRRTRQTPKQAAETLVLLENAKALLDAEEACDDPLKMVPYLLENKAVQGRVVSFDRDHREICMKNRMRRPLLTLRSPEPCLMPTGKKLWWSENPSGQTWEVYEVVHHTDGGATVTLKLTTSAGTAPVPHIGAQACFSIHTTKAGWLPQLPDLEPWSHQPSEDQSEPESIEEIEEQKP